MDLNTIFSSKMTENGDFSYNTTGDNLIDILFMTEYYQNHLNDVKIGKSYIEKIFSMFIRDPRFGLGRRDLGRQLMVKSGVSAVDVVKAGRFDDLFTGWEHMPEDVFKNMCDFLYNEIIKGNELCKKWMPRYSSKNLMLARKIANVFGMNKQQYGHFIKSNTVENNLSRHNTDSIEFDKIPSLALLKYWNRFAVKDDTKDRFAKYLEDVKKGNKKVNVSTTNVYDIYRNRKKIDADLMFDQIEKIDIDCMVILDTSGSMMDSNDSFGKACAIGHYLTKCNTFMPNHLISFSSNPKLIELSTDSSKVIKNWSPFGHKNQDNISNYELEIESMYTGDCSNTDFGKVCELIKKLDKDHAPKYFIVLSDMEFDEGSHQSAKELQDMFKTYGFNTNLIWWSFNSRNKTVTFKHDEYGNIYLSGYSPVLLKYLEVGFDSQQFLKKLLDEYAKKIA